MGSHRKPSRVRLKHLLSSAAVPALAATAAAVCLAPQALADPAPANAAAQTTAVSYAGLSAAALQPAKQLAAIRPAAKAQQAQPVKYTVRSGDSLSSIAGHFYHKQNAWPVLYWANRGKIRWANILSTGQVLKIPAEPAKMPAAPALLEPAAPPAAPAPVASATAYAPAQTPAPVAGSYSGGTPGGSFAQCVISRESGGNSQVMNSSGHYGLYQFSESTWVAYGGSAADFGHASVAEQNQVFNNALAQGGQSNWSPYDGC